MACGVGLVDDAELVEAAGDVADVGDEAGLVWAEPVGAGLDRAEPVGAEVALAWGLVVAASLPPKAFQALRPATARAAMTAITISHLRTFAPLRRRRCSQTLPRQVTVDGDPRSSTADAPRQAGCGSGYHGQLAKKLFNWTW